jgi:hypothetical protein
MNSRVPPADRPPSRPRRPGGRLAVLLVAAGLTGGAGATGVLAASGALDQAAAPAGTTQVVSRLPPPPARA